MNLSIKRTIRSITISTLLQGMLNVALLVLAAVLCILLVKETRLLLLSLAHAPAVHEVLEHVLIFFLYFEFIAMISKYFQENYHFPLRYFLYIGITAMIRLIIVNHDNPMHTLLYAFVVLVLIIAYFIINSTPLRRDRH
ncbi:protein PsiE [Aneurinibacillus soli]|uniref:Protein PsiE n=1 Tax=Aneurinibacillus soli TaxID=1500254 RepID=A0A0U5BAP2_9BACL|nr:phosphate-starvation-inducible protein PsiE [Aneurinibacillus soli]PYE62102.1 protein PsiE [Aneurinibacillus soli]BAU28710.1 phosphate-starvation-inducible protein PsiE [Aneurinibacillus soli]